MAYIGRDVIQERQALPQEEQELVDSTMKFMIREAKVQGLWPQLDHCDGISKVELAIIDWVKNQTQG